MTQEYFKVLVCGGRYYSNSKNIFSILDDIKAVIEQNNNTFNTNTEIKIINGGARGADNISTDWAKQNNVSLDIYLADWDKYKKAAGHIRNKLMFTSSNPDIIIAFNGGRGTQNMIELAKSNDYILEDLTKDKECQILYRP